MTVSRGVDGVAFIQDIDNPERGILLNTNETTAEELTDLLNTGTLCEFNVFFRPGYRISRI